MPPRAYNLYPLKVCPMLFLKNVYYCPSPSEEIFLKIFICKDSLRAFQPMFNLSPRLLCAGSLTCFILTSSFLWYFHFSVSHFPHPLLLHSCAFVYFCTEAMEVCALIANSSCSHFQILKKDEVIEWPGTLAIVHSYISYKAGNRFESW